MRFGRLQVFGTDTESTLFSQFQNIPIDSTLLAALVGGVAGLVGSLVVSVMSVRADRRKQAVSDFSDALSDALGWVEFIYVIHRRSVGTAARGEIRDRMNDLQQKLTHHQSWLRIASTEVHVAYKELVGKVKSECAKPMQDGWDKAPIKNDSEMNLGISVATPRCETEITNYVSKVEKHLRGYVFKFWK